MIFFSIQILSSWLEILKMYLLSVYLTKNKSVQELNGFNVTYIMIIII